MNPLIKTVRVAVGVIVNQQAQVLIALRNLQQHQGGLWEFPGGKVEQGETVKQALSRELLEEVNIKLEDGSHLLKIEHDYGDKQVLLDVWYITKFSGLAMGREGQEVKWIEIADLDSYNFPKANQKIISALLNMQ